MFFTPLALAAALGLSLLLPGAASAMVMVAGNEVDADCFSVDTSTQPGVRNHDAVNGNYWKRHDTFTYTAGDNGCNFQDFISGISIVIKTPFQIDSTPDIDDLDTGADFSILEGQMQSDFPEFIDDFGGAAMTDATGTAPPAVGSSGAFIGARICINTDIGDCNVGSALPLMDIGGGQMIFTIDLDPSEDGIGVCDDFSTSGCDFSSSFTLVTIAHSNQFTPAAPGSAIVPEMVLGWRMVELAYVPEPSLAALLLPVLLAGALRRRRH